MNGKILVVDDESGVHEMIATMLKGRDKPKPVDLFSGQHQSPPSSPVASTTHLITHLHDAEEAQEAMEQAYQNQEPYQLLITDLRMPGRSGDWLIRQSRRLDSRIRVIVFSAVADVSLEQIRESAGEGSFIYLDKMVAPMVFVQAVESELATWHANYRKYPREAYDRKMHFHLPEGLEGQVVDISDGGIGILDIPLEVVVNSHLEIRLEEAGCPVGGTVRWVRRQGSKFRVGIEFDEPVHWKPSMLKSQQLELSD